MKTVEFTEYIAPDGYVYKFDTNDRFLMSEEGLGMPPIEYITQKGPFQHGESLIDFRLGTRTIQLMMRQDSCSRQSYWEKRSLLINSIRPNRYTGAHFTSGRLRKHYSDGLVRDLNVVIEQGPIFTARSLDRWDEHGFTETLRFIAHDPLFYDPLSKNMFWESMLEPESEEQITFPITFPITIGGSSFSTIKHITYAGTWFSFPTIVITGPQNGFTVTNLSTQESISLNYNIASGEVVTISLQYGNKQVYNNSGTNLIGTVTNTSSLATFHVAPDPEVPDGINYFQIASTGIDENSRVLIEYQERFIGI